MYSMKRISARRLFANSSSSTSSSSLIPRITTVSSFRLANGVSAAASIPRSTAACWAKRVSAWNRAGRRVSRLTVMRWSPAARSRAAWSGQEHAVRRQREVADAGILREPFDEVRQVPAQQRLAPRQAHPIDPDLGEDAREPVQFVDPQDVRARQPGVVRLGHTVLAPQIAAVGDGEPQATGRAIEAVEYHVLQFPTVNDAESLQP